MYIHKQKDWPNFIWNNDELFDIITKVSFKQGELLGKMQSLGFDFRQEALLNNLTEEITKSSEIEGELLNKDEVRSSIAKRLNIHNAKPINSSHHIDGVVEIWEDGNHYVAQITPQAGEIKKIPLEGRKCSVKDGEKVAAGATLVRKSGDKPAIKALVKALQSDKVRKYIDEKFPNGEVVVVF